MRRASTLASSTTSRTLCSSSAGATSSFTLNNRIFQAALFCSSSIGSTNSRRSWFFFIRNYVFSSSTGAASLGIAGVVVSLGAATSLSQEVYAKEPVQPDLVPKEVVLYQYEACPFCNKMYEKAVKLYAELAKVAINSFLISKDSPVIDPVRIHYGAQENKEALRKSRGEEDEDFQILEYQAQKGNAAAMYRVGLFYYFGLRGMKRDHAKALFWFSKAVERGEQRSMELLGEIYTRGAGVERNYTKALKWLQHASEQPIYPAYNGLGYLYVKGYGVEKYNYTKAKEYFEKAVVNDEAGGHYNLGAMYLKGIGVKRDLKEASSHFILAANNGQPKGFYQLAKMFQTGVGLKKNLQMVN